MIVFLVSGLWHGASWTYIIWGALNGFYQVIGSYTSNIRKRVTAFLKIKTDCWSYRALQVVITFLLIDFSWIFFRASTLQDSIIVIKRMLTSFYPWQIFDGTLLKLGLDSKDFLVMVISIAVLCIVDFLRYRVSIRGWLAEQNLIFRWGVYYTAIFTLILFGVYGVGSEASQFIYFQF